VVWLWFKGVDEFLTGGPPIAQNEDLH
jgi:hypothetical protein